MASQSASTDGSLLGEKLETEYGPVMAEPAIAKVLGFHTVGALRKAIQRERLIGLPLFRMRGRPGWNVYSTDLGAWIDACRAMSLEPQQ